MMHYDWIDRWKGLLIIFVVAGHVVGGASHLCTGADSAVCSYLYKVIYMFHMPAFFFLAGLCWRSIPMQSFSAFFYKKARRLLVPYFAFGLVSVLIYLVMTSGGDLFAAAKTGYYAGKGATHLLQPFLSILHGGGWPHGEGFRCNSVLWFLPAMFSVLCFYWALDRILPRRTPQLVIAGLLLVFAFYKGRLGIGALPFGLSHIPWYGSFVIFGRQLPMVSREVVDSRLTRLVTCGGVFGYLVIAALLPNAYFANCRFSWYLLFFVMALGGIVLNAQLAKMMQFRFLAHCGTSSLGIMVIHKFVVLLLQVKIPFVARWGDSSSTLFWLANIVVLVAGVFVSSLATRLICRVAPWVLGDSKA